MMMSLLLGASLWADNYFGLCYNFVGDGSAEVWNSETLHLQNDITIEVWINVNSWDEAWQTIISKGDTAWRLHRNNQTSQINFSIGNNPTYSVSSTGINFINQWHHVAAVKSGTQLLLYIDGVLNAISTCSSTIPSNAYPIKIGENAQTGPRYFNGKMDELRVWNHARTAEQIKYGRYNQLSGYETGLSIYYQMNVVSLDWVSPGPHALLPWATLDWWLVSSYEASDILDESYSGDRMYQYNGFSESVVHTPLWSSPPSQFTAEVWYKAHEINSAQQTILYHGDNGEYQITTQNNVLTARIKRNSSDWWNLSFDNFKAQQWYLISFSVDVSGLAALYINGVLVDSGTPPAMTNLYDPGSDYVASIGSYNGSSGFIRGVVDEVRIWDFALGASQIWDQRHVELTGSEDGLLAYYQFNESGGAVIFNQADNQDNLARYINCITSQPNSRITSYWPKNSFFLGGTISEDLTIPSGLIEVWDDVIIPSESKLTVSAGSIVRFMDHYGIAARGSLQALGTPADSILFTVANHTGFDIPLGGEINTTGSWNGLAITTSATSDSTLLLHCAFEYAKAGGVNLESSDHYDGGAIHLGGTASYRIENCRFSNNLAKLQGGAIRAGGLGLSGGIIRNCNFFDNKSIGSESTSGGAIHVYGTPVLIENCRITGNQTNGHGGGISVYHTDAGFNVFSKIFGCYIANNYAVGHGGGIAFQGHGSSANFFASHPTLVRGNLITQNTASIGGGIAWKNDEGNLSTHAQVTSNIISYNTATKGGAISFSAMHTRQYGEYGGANDRMGLRNNTIVYNEATTCGGAFYFEYPTSTGVNNTRIRNSILWGNTAPSGSQVYTNDTRAIIHFIYNLIEDGLSGFAGAYTPTYLNNLETDPLLIGSGEHPYKVQPFSPCVNRGQPGSTANDYDFTGNPRIYQPGGTVTPAIDTILSTIDIGAYEDQSDIGLLPHDHTISGNVDVGHRLTVPSGFKLTIEGGSELVFAPDMGIDIYGSLESIGSSAQNRNRMRALNESLGWRGLVFHGGSNPADTTYLYQTVISGGKAVSGSRTKGGLILVDGYDALNISNCILSCGEAISGGALAVLNSSAEFYNNYIYGCSATNGGGAVYLENSTSRLVNQTITGSQSASGGGGIHAVSSSSARIAGNNIWDNGDTPMNGQMVVIFSNIEGGYAGSTNINVDPRLAVGDDPDQSYILQPSSPVMNRGITETYDYPLLPDTDLADNPRINQHTLSMYNRMDIGAFEYPGIMAPSDFIASDGDNNRPGHVYLSWNYHSYYQPVNGFQVFRDGKLMIE